LRFSGTREKRNGSQHARRIANDNGRNGMKQREQIKITDNRNTNNNGNEHRRKGTQEKQNKCIYRRFPASGNVLKLSKGTNTGTESERDKIGYIITII